jgi:hypothetical protein
MLAAIMKISDIATIEREPDAAKISFRFNRSATKANRILPKKNRLNKDMEIKWYISLL